MNAAQHATSLGLVQALASVGSLFQYHFPAASINFSPWRDDSQTQLWFEEDSLDLALNFPGWNHSLQCRSLLIQLRVGKDEPSDLPFLLGVIIRGITFSGERWHLVTVGDWQPTGTHLPKKVVMDKLHEICRELFVLFHSD